LLKLFAAVKFHSILHDALLDEFWQGIEIFLYLLIEFLHFFHLLLHFWLVWQFYRETCIYRFVRPYETEAGKLSGAEKIYDNRGRAGQGIFWRH